MSIKQFTVKDFLTYTNPCFICGNKINFLFFRQNINKKESTMMSITPEVYIDHITLPLSITYKRSVILTIDNKTNSIYWEGSFEEFCSKYTLSLYSYCPNKECNAWIMSQPLSISFLKMHIAPTTIQREAFILRDKNIFYIVNTVMSDNHTRVVFYDDLKEDNQSGDGKQELFLPALPIYKFKTKENFIEKIKKYIIFS